MEEYDLLAGNMEQMQADMVFAFRKGDTNVDWHSAVSEDVKNYWMTDGSARSNQIILENQAIRLREEMQVQHRLRETSIEILKYKHIVAFSVRWATICRA